MKKLFIFALTLASATAFAQGYKAGDKAMDFSLVNVDGKKVSLADYTGAKGFIVMFTCNHCPVVVKNEDRINDLNEKYEPQGYPVIAINPTDSLQFPDDNFEAMQVRAQEKSFSFPYLLDNTQKIARTYGATKTPHVYVLQKENNGLVVKYTGAIDDNPDSATGVKEKYVENAVNALLAGKSIAKTSTKAIGCGINWRK